MLLQERPSATDLLLLLLLPQLCVQAVLLPLPPLQGEAICSVDTLILHLTAVLASHRIAALAFSSLAAAGSQTGPLQPFGRRR